MSKPVYINGAGVISPQKTWGDDAWTSAIDHSGVEMFCVEPDYTQYVEAKNLRRMSRILKMGNAASAMALKEANVSMPDGILTGTGYGCLEDTGSFLKKMISQQELNLNPTPFIQSTHNTIGSQVALLLQCQGYNQTYTQEGISFENALTDAILLLSENPQHVLLTGAADEITPLSHSVQQRFGLFRETSTSSLELFSDSGKKGTLHGEGVAYFALSGQKAPHCTTSIVSVASFFGSIEATAIRSFLSDASVNADELDLVLTGRCGDDQLDRQFNAELELFPSTPKGTFKHLCGESPTAVGFAIGLADQILRSQKIPAEVVRIETPRPVRSILIWNSWAGRYHSLILLKGC